MAALFVVATTLIGCVGEAPTIAERVIGDEQLAARIDEVGTEALAELPVAGLTVAVARGDELAFAGGYGEADVAAGHPAGARTVYPIGSISKQFTAATVLRLAEQGDLDLDDPVSRYVPEVDGEVMPTVRQLLSHTSGLTDARLGPALEASSDGVGMDWEDAVALAVEPGYRVEPGSGFEYSNGGYLIAYGVVEGATGHGYRSALEDLIHHAALEDTTVCNGDPGTGVAHGYQQQYDLWARVARLGRTPGLRLADPYNPDLLHVVCSTAPDLAKWAHRLRAGEVVDEASYRSMAERVTLTDGTVVPYGLGLQRRRFGEHVANSHGGILTGYVSMLADFPADDTTVALLINTDLDQRDTQMLLLRLLGAVFDEPPDQGWVEDLALEPSRRPGGGR